MKESTKSNITLTMIGVGILAILALMFVEFVYRHAGRVSEKAARRDAGCCECKQ